MKNRNLFIWYSERVKRSKKYVSANRISSLIKILNDSWKKMVNKNTWHTENRKQNLKQYID